MPADARLLARLRQACAEGRTADAATMRAEIDALGDLSPRWLAAQIMGDVGAAAELLRPLDRPDQLPTLIRYLIDPSFEPRTYPDLMRQLTRDGIDPPRAIAIPRGCRAA